VELLTLLMVLYFIYFDSITSDSAGSLSKDISSNFGIFEIYFNFVENEMFNRLICLSLDVSLLLRQYVLSRKRTIDRHLAAESLALESVIYIIEYI
jgi:hypothetical protein